MTKVAKYGASIAAAATFLAFAVTAGAYTVADFGSVTLKKGSSGSAVASMQMALNSCSGTTLNADGKFGAMTDAAVRAFQASHNLKVDGLVGMGTKAALATCGTPSTPGTSTVPGCMPGALFSSTTGQSCTSTTPSSVPGCTPGAMFSSTTGQACTPGTTPSTGGAGSITTTELSTYTSQNVAKGAVDKYVSEFKVKASGSNVSVTAVGVKLAFSGSGSARLEKYFSSVSVFKGNTKIGEIPSSAFTQESSTNTYSATLVLNTPAGVALGTEEKFAIGVTALPEIDSANLGSSNNVWTVTVNQVRYVDGTNTTLVDSSTQPDQTFSFTALSSAVNTEAQFSLDSSNPSAQLVRVDTGSNTNGVALLKFVIRAVGSDLYIDDMPVKLTVTSGQNVSDIVANLILNINGTSFSASPASTSACTSSNTCKVVFYDVNYIKLAAGSVANVTVSADLKNINSGVFDEGDTVKAEVTSTEYNAARIEDTNRDSLATNKRTGSAIGETMTLRSKGISLSFLGSSIQTVPGSGSDDDSATFNIRFRVTANGSDVYIPRTVGSSGVNYSLTKNGSSATATGAVLSDNTDATTGTITNSVFYKIANGASEDFTLAVSQVNSSGDAGIYQAYMNQIKWYFTDATSVPGSDDGSFTTSTYNFNTYKTDPITLN